MEKVKQKAAKVSFPAKQNKKVVHCCQSAFLPGSPLCAHSHVLGMNS
jgi:hypothetical protein